MKPDPRINHGGDFVDEPSFQFVIAPDKNAEELDPSTLVVRVPTGIDRKQTLLRTFATQLRFSNYFGWNWDALRDCLSDLNWLDPMPQRIVIRHDDIPLAADSGAATIYLSILDELARNTPPPKFEVVFPEHHAAFIRDLWKNQTCR